MTPALVATNYNDVSKSVTLLNKQRTITQIVNLSHGTTFFQ